MDTASPTDNTFGQSVVESCGVTICSFNHVGHCHAGAVQIALYEGMPHCATFAPADGAIAFDGGQAATALDAPRRAGTDDQALGS